MTWSSFGRLVAGLVGDVLYIIGRPVMSYLHHASKRSGR